MESVPQHGQRPAGQHRGPGDRGGDHRHHMAGAEGDERRGR